MPEQTRILTRNFEDPRNHLLESYLAQGGYEGLKKALGMKPDEVIEEVKKSSLRGLGGAGFYAGVKWGFMPKEPKGPQYLVVNGDEGEPGTFKDRYLLMHAPHQLLEGIAIACWAIRAKTAWIYLRGEYVRPKERVLEAIREAREKGFLGKNILGSGWDVDVHVHSGAGAYICGEESALLESLEGKKGQPRLRPPFPAQRGAFGMPTTVNNVETLSHVPHILKNGAEWFAALGSPKNGGTRVFAVSGHVEKPGIIEAPMGIPLRDLIALAGGVRRPNKLKAVIPGGSSAQILTAAEASVPMDFDALKAAGTMGGSGAVVVLDDTTCIVKALYYVTRFYSHESCGQCSPCREGTGWAERILVRILRGQGRPSDIDTLLSAADNFAFTTICALAAGAAFPIQSYIAKFRGEFEHHVKHGRCDIPGCEPPVLPEPRPLPQGTIAPALAAIGR